MKKISKLSLMVLLSIWSYSALAQTNSSTNGYSHLNDSGVTFNEYINYLQNLPQVQSDTDEGGLKAQLEAVKILWYPRAVRNDSSAQNMFMQYARALNDAVQARLSSMCPSGSYFQGNWSAIGPTKLNIQAVGYINKVWADPSNQNYVLAATAGGLFKTINGGANWECITDNAPIGNGVMGISSIAVNPTNTLEIYLGTSCSIYGEDNGFSMIPSNIGASILHTKNGGLSWNQEIIPNTPATNFDDMRQIQGIFITPNGSQVYACSGNQIFTSANIATLAWSNVTPSTTNTHILWKDIDFVSGSPNHLIATSKHGGSQPGTWTAQVMYGEWNGATVNWTDLTVAFGNAIPAFNSNYQLRFNASIPNGNVAYILGLDGTISPLLKYNLSTHQFTIVNTDCGLNDNGSRSEIEVSPANTAIIYVGDTQPKVSLDGGLSFQTIGTYWCAPTHADIRSIFIQKATNTTNGKGDIVFFATDGGVSKKPANNDPAVLGEQTTIDISGEGLICDKLWDVSTSEQGGLVTAGAMHDGIFSYEPQQVQKCFVSSVSGTVSDAASTFFDKANRSTAYCLEWDYPSISSPAGGRKIGGWSHDIPFNEGGVPATPLCSDEHNNHYAGRLNLLTRTGPGLQWLSVGVSNNPRLGLPLNPNSNTFIPIHNISINPYLSNTNDAYGYLFYNSNSNSNFQGLFVRNINDPNNIKKFTSKSVPASDTYPLIDVAHDPKNMNRVWVSMGGIYYGATNKWRVQYSKDGGNNWYDISYGLPLRMPVTALVFQEGVNKVYAATDVGIYFADMQNFNSNATLVNGVNQSVQWQCFNKGAIGQHDFPNVTVTKLTINYCEGKLYASCYGRGVWSTDLMMETPNYPNPIIGDLVPDPTDTIKVNTIWNADKVIYTGIYVMPKVTLTINSPAVIHMPKNGALVVAKGAILNVNGAKLTNDCSGLWKGILVLGDPNLPQYPNGSGNPDPNHGIAVMTNGATIEHARIGIANYGESLSYGWNMSGGIIYTEGANITNCTRGVVFAPYQAKLNGNLIPDVSLINKVNFVVDDNYKGEDLGYYFQAHATLSNINGVRFRDNNFSNLSTKPNTKGTGSGIISWCAGYSVYPSIVSPTFGNKFWGFSIGINANAPITANNLISVDNSTFNENGIGMQMLNGSPFHAYRNLFSIGNSFNPICTSCNYNMGIYTSDNHQAIKIQENTFSNAVKNWQSIGINVTNCSSYGQTNIYKNNFANLTYGNLSIGTNKPLNSVGHVNEGLLYQCNLFNPRSLTYDIYVANGKGINPIQGGYTLSKPSVKMPSGNLFFPSPGNVFNYGDFFAYYLTGYVYENIAMPSNNIATFLIANTNTCATHLTNNPGGELLISGGGGNGCSSSTNSTTRLANYAFYNGAWSALSNELQSKMDKGNTSDLLNTILNSNDAITLRSQLLTLSPFLSRKVLKATIDNNKLPMGMMMDVLQANPEALRRDTFLNYLQYLAPNPYPQDAIILLKQYAAQTSERTEFELNIGTAYDSMKIVANGAIEQLLTDSLGYNPDTLIAWYNRIPEITARYAIAGFHLYNKDFGKMNNVFSAIPTEFNVVNENKLNEVNSLQELYGVIAGVLGRGAFDNQLSETELAQVHDIANRGHGLASQTALAYELHAKDSSIRTCPYLPEIGNNRMAVPLEDQYVRATNNVVKVFPNPAKDFVNIIYDLPLAKGIIHLTVTDLSGRNIFETTLKDNLGQTWIDTRNYSNGTYLYEFKDETKSLSAGKITVNK